MPCAKYLAEGAQVILTSCTVHQGAILCSSHLFQRDLHEKDVVGWLNPLPEALKLHQAEREFPDPVHW